MCMLVSLWRSSKRASWPQRSISPQPTKPLHHPPHQPPSSTPTSTPTTIHHTHLHLHLHLLPTWHHKMQPSKEVQGSTASGESTQLIHFSHMILSLTFLSPGTINQGSEHRRITAEQRADGHTILRLSFFFSLFFFFLSFFFFSF